MKKFFETILEWIIYDIKTGLFAFFDILFQIASGYGLYRGIKLYSEGNVLMCIVIVIASLIVFLFGFLIAIKYVNKNKNCDKYDARGATRTGAFGTIGLLLAQLMMVAITFLLLAIGIV